MEDFFTALKLYAELQQSKGSIDHEAEDIAANCSAARAQYTWMNGVHQMEDFKPSESYEVYFNLAYEKIALRRLEEAESALKQAQSTSIRLQILTFRIVWSFWLEWR